MGRVRLTASATGGWIAGLTVVGLAWLALKTFGFHLYAGDEHIYAYQGLLVSRGVAPYSGFAAAHPPLQLLVAAAVIGLFDYQPMLFRLLPVAWALAGGVALAVLVRRELDAVASVAAFAFALLSYEPLRAASHFTGVNMTCALIVVSLLLLRCGRSTAGGVVAAAAVLTRLYALPLVAVMGVWTLWRDRRSGLRYAGAASVSMLVSVLTLAMISGWGPLYRELVGFHLAKTPADPELPLRVYRAAIFHDSPSALLFLLGVTGLTFLGWRVGGKELLALATTAVFAHLLAVASLDRVFSYYLVPAYAFAAIPAGWLVARWYSGARALVRRRGEWPGAWSWVLLGLFAVGWWLGPQLERMQSYYARRTASPEAAVVRYGWLEPPLLPRPLAALVRRVFWRDERIIGKRYCNVSYLLWHESRTFDVAPAIATQVGPGSADDGSIFGDSSSVPLIALLTGRPIAGNEVDTNVQRYLSGFADAGALVSRIEREAPRFILLQPRFGVGGLDAVQELVNRRYSRGRAYRDGRGREYVLYDRSVPGGP